MKFSCHEHGPCLSSELLQVFLACIITYVLLNGTWGKLITVLHSGYVGPFKLAEVFYCYRARGTQESNVR